MLSGQHTIECGNGCVPLSRQLSLSFDYMHVYLVSAQLLLLLSAAINTKANTLIVVTLFPHISFSFFSYQCNNIFINVFGPHSEDNKILFT